MKDGDKTKEQLLSELAELRNSLADLEKSEGRRRQAEQEILNASTLNQTILDTSPAAIIIYKASGPGVLANEAAARIVGGSQEQLAALNFHSIASWKTCGLYEAACEAIATGRVVRIETDFMTTTFGKRICIEAIFSTFLLGEEPYLALLFNDITERKRAEEDLRTSEAVYRTLIEQLPPGTWVYKAALDEIASTIYVSPQIEELGFTQQEWIAGHDWWSRQLYSDDRERTLSTFRRSREHYEPFVCEYRMYARDKSVRWYRDHAVVVRDGNGTPLFFQGVMTDITERRQTEDALRRSEERYRTLAEAAHDMIFIIDREGYIEYVNHSAAQQFGLKPEELIGRRRAEMFQQPESERQQFNLNRIFESGEPLYREDESPTRFPAGDKWLGTWLVPLRNDDGSVRAVLGISRDITERRVMEDQLRESKLMLQSVLDTILVRVFWKDLNSVFLGCNRPFALDAGLSDPSELLGKDDYAMGWREQADLYRGDDRQVMESGIPKLNFEEPQTTPDGKQIILKTSKIPLRDSRGRIRGVLGTYEDITERKQAEAELRMLSTAIEQSPASVVITDAGGNIEYVNPKFTRLTGYTFEEAIGKNPRILKSDVLPQEEYERLWQTITSGDVWRGEFCNKKKNGDLYWESAVISPVKDTNGVITHFLAVKEDITELKKAAEEKKGLEAQLRQAQKLETIGTLAGGIAHDFNNILQPLNSCAELIRSRIPAGSPLVKYVDLISRSVERGSGLVKQLLAFSRQSEHERRPLRLQPVLSETLSLLRAVVPATVKIHEEIDPACGPVLADPVQVQQVVMNLCTNACDAMSKNGVLTVRLAEVDIDEVAAWGNLRLRAGRYAQIMVRDTGHGMNDETQKRIFDPFFTTKEVGKGTGLGLSVVHGIVLEHGGEIVVESAPARGTTFCVYLPCSGDVTGEESPRGEDMIDEGNGSILFVDDEEDIVLIGREMLEHLGYHVSAMTRNAEALEEFRQNPGGYDLVISDYSMPGMNGVQLAWELLNVRPDIPILLISGNNEAIPAERLKEMAVRGVISKPFNMSELGEAIRRVLRG